MPSTDRMPVVFVGHGTPRSAVWTNEWTASWEKLGAALPRPSAILSISAHWLTRGGALVTASRKPRMNYDFYGFPEEMYKVTYPAPGNVELAQEIQTSLAAELPVKSDAEWGFDHGTWVVLKYMFPKADIPVIQLSIDYSKPSSFHYELGKHLTSLRTRGVLILGSGNMVHNLNMRPGMNNDQPYDWAMEFDADDLEAYSGWKPSSSSRLPEDGKRGGASPSYVRSFSSFALLSRSQDRQGWNPHI